jgi:hypothetical protein
MSSVLLAPAALDDAMPMIAFFLILLAIIGIGEALRHLFGDDD